MFKSQTYKTMNQRYELKGPVNSFTDSSFIIGLAWKWLLHGGHWAKL